MAAYSSVDFLVRVVRLSLLTREAIITLLAAVSLFTTIEIRLVYKLFSP